MRPDAVAKACSSIVLGPLRAGGQHMIAAGSAVSRDVGELSVKRAMSAMPSMSWSKGEIEVVALSEGGPAVRLAVLREGASPEKWPP